MCLVLKFGVVNSNDKKNSAYIFSEILPIYLILRGNICCGLTFEYNHDNRSPPALKVLMKALLIAHAPGQSDTSNPSNSKMSAIKIVFLLCGVFVII